MTLPKCGMDGCRKTVKALGRVYCSRQCSGFGAHAKQSVEVRQQHTARMVQVNRERSLVAMRRDLRSACGEALKGRLMIPTREVLDLLVKFGRVRYRAGWHAGRIARDRVDVGRKDPAA